MQASGLSTGPNYTRRSLLSRASQWSALVAAYPLIPLPNLAEPLARDARVAQAPVVDKGFASVRKIENPYTVDSGLMKTVRVVTSVQYYLER